MEQSIADSLRRSAESAEASWQDLDELEQYIKENNEDAARTLVWNLQRKTGTNG